MLDYCYYYYTFLSLSMGDIPILTQNKIKATLMQTEDSLKHWTVNE